MRTMEIFGMDFDMGMVWLNMQLGIHMNGPGLLDGSNLNLHFFLKCQRLRGRKSLLNTADILDGKCCQNDGHH